MPPGKATPEELLKQIRAQLGPISEQLTALSKAQERQGRDMEADRRTRGEDHAATTKRLDDHADLLKNAFEQINVVSKKVARREEEAAKQDDGPPKISWLTPGSDPAPALAALQELAAWLEAVYLRFPAAELPSCWYDHAWVVEELLALRYAHAAAWSAKAAPKERGEWLDKHRPGVVKRIAALAACGLENHPLPPPLPVPGVDALNRVVLAYVEDGVMPHPTPPEIADAAVYEAAREVRASNRNARV